jgi:hypothetical protein
MKFTFLRDYNTDQCFHHNVDADPIDPADLGSVGSRSCLMRQEGLDDHEPMIPVDSAEPVDDYFSKLHSVDRLQAMCEEVL